ncbi:hypothetical protein [Dyella humicola]|uniref:hypothetical protein n=1 Tax=Dyella humicola TaxID=2992126 RepID=UPI00224E351A|nr:hypothetical protein [Dyella humicola]
MANQLDVFVRMTNLVAIAMVFVMRCVGWAQSGAEQGGAFSLSPAPKGVPFRGAEGSGEVGLAEELARS